MNPWWNNQWYVIQIDEDESGPDQVGIGPYEDDEADAILYLSTDIPLDDRLELAQQIVDAHNIVIEKSRKQEIVNLTQTIRDLEKKRYKLIEDCPHNDLVINTTVRCDVCGKPFGWACPQSPDKICHYDCEIDDGNIELINKTFVPSPVPTPEEHEWSEYCIYCGQPSERK